MSYEDRVSWVKSVINKTISDKIPTSINNYTLNTFYNVSEDKHRIQFKLSGMDIKSNKAANACTEFVFPSEGFIKSDPDKNKYEYIVSNELTGLIFRIIKVIKKQERSNI